MDRQKLLQGVAPCSIVCYTCIDCKDGVIQECASKLCNYLEGLYDFHRTDLPQDPSQFEVFCQELLSFTNPQCPGCRNSPPLDSGCVEGCVVPGCAKNRKVDFCAECPDFPCETANTFFTSISSELAQTWINGSKRIQKIGIENYFNEKKSASHYIRSED